MKKVLTVFCLLGLIGCSATQQPDKPEQTPYKVVKTLESARVLKGEDLPLGVIQNKLADTHYLITTKLGAYSKMRRAHSMALLHAANLAVENGYLGFTVDQIQKNGWCQTLRQRRTEFIQGSNGGVTTRLVVTLSNDESLPDFKNANTVIAFHQPIVNKIFTTDELTQIAASRSEQCLKQSQKRTGRRLLNNQ